MSGGSMPASTTDVHAPAAHPGPTLTTPPSAPYRDPGTHLTKNGTVSKMRSHRGNVPTLPQTKFCHLCSAKFTRTTHLNRHLKTHSNERLHECDRCHAQFTRSDLLTRHKRTCCDSTVNRSRRKSCQSCADSKVKCDLQKPCSKCKARGRECVYMNASTIPEEADSYSQNVPSPTVESGLAASSSSYPHPIPPRTGMSPGTSESAGTPSTVQTPTEVFNDPTSAFIFAPALPQNFNVSPALPAFTPGVAVPQPTSQTVIDRNGLNGYYSELFSSEIYDDLFSDLFTSFQKNPAVPGQHFNQDPTTVLTDRLQATGIDQALVSAFYETPTQLAIYPMPTSPDSSCQEAANTIPEDEVMLAGPSSGTMVRRPMPSVPEFYDYISTFMHTFLYHMPVVHLPTFLAEPRHITLVKATKAIGAMYANTVVGNNFIDLVLSTLRDDIIAELSQPTTDYDTMIQVTIASGLIQTIGLFHKDPDQRAKSNVYHGMIVMMLRMSGFVEKTRDWKLPDIDFSDPVSVRIAWREWVRHESAKRALWMCYLHDCCHSIYFNLSSTFHTEQFTLGLPAEDALWTAQDPMEWAMVLQRPSPYGSVEVRLCGHYLKALYFYLSSDNPDNSPRPFNVTPFAHFIMIHAMMRKLFEMYLRDRLPFHEGVGHVPSPGPSHGASAHGGMGSSAAAVVDAAAPQPQSPHVKPHFVNQDRAFHVQILLHYWLQSWLESPETPRDVPETQQRFVFNALPFYWLAQVGLVAYQQGLPPFDPDGTYITSHEAKFNLLKKWEKHIRRFLESGEQTSTRFWDEVMKIRIETWQAESGFEYPHLLGFFHPPSRAQA